MEVKDHQQCKFKSCLWLPISQTFLLYVICGLRARYVEIGLESDIEVLNCSHRFPHRGFESYGLVMVSTGINEKLEYKY